MKGIFAHRMPHATPERSEVISRLALRGFECSFKAEPVVNSAQITGVRHRGLPLLASAACSPSPAPRAKHTRSFQMCLSPAEAEEAEAPAGFGAGLLGCSRGKLCWQPRTEGKVFVAQVGSTQPGLGRAAGLAVKAEMLPQGTEQGCAPPVPEGLVQKAIER